MKRHLGLFGLGSSVLLAAFAVSACSDSETPAGTAGQGGKATGGTTGAAGSSGGSAGANGGTAGSSTGGVAGEAGTAGTGTAGTSTAGAAGSDGGAGGVAALAPVRAETTQLLPGALNPYGLRFAKDGKLYVSGATLVPLDGGGTDQRLAVWRFGVDGKLDTSFGKSGVATTPISGAETSYDLVELRDGSFVVQAVSAGMVYVVTMSSAGEFGTPVALPFGWTAEQRSAVDAACVAAAAACDKVTPDADCADKTTACQTLWPAAVAPKFTQRPTYVCWGIGLDSRGDSDRVVVFASGPAKSGAQADGKQRVDGDRWITRLQVPAFTVDPTFNGGADFSLDVTGQTLADSARRGLVEADGSIVSSGYSDLGKGKNLHVALLRLKADGKPDPAFGFDAPSAGVALFNPTLSASIEGAAESYAVVKIGTQYVTTGYGRSYAFTETKQNDLVSFRTDGSSLDASWGALGTLAVQSEVDKAAGLGTTAFRDTGRHLVALEDGRTVQVGGYDDFAAIYVVDKNGKLDAGSGNGGILRYPVSGAFYGVARSADGKRIAAATQTPTGGSPLLVTLTLD